MSDAEPTFNPFPGPQPYRAADRARFFGRDVVVKKLTNQLLAHACTTLYGPSGAGKSSVMQAGVIPRLEELHDFRVVRVDGWPPGEEPLPWLVRSMFADLELGAPPERGSALAALGQALSLAERQSEQPILIYLDQLEQLLFPERDAAHAEKLITGVERLAEAPIRGLQIVLSMREDYLGRFRDRARDRRELLAYGFRLGPLTVGEMVRAVCMSASAAPAPQLWDPPQITDLMMEVRTPGQAVSTEAEVQAAYGQIVCRALFQERALRLARGDDESTENFARRSLIMERARGKDEVTSEAEAILLRYLDKTLDDLGELRADARRLLEDHLVAADGSRTLRTEKELLRVLPPDKLAPILKTLEAAAILYAEAHQGTRYFEIGHDWLARKVHEERQERERHEEQRRREEEQAAEHRRREEELAAEHRRQSEEAAAKLAKERGQRRLYAIVALVALAVAAGAAALGLYAWRLRNNARAAEQDARAAEARATKNEGEARQKAIEASDARLMSGFRELKNSGQLAWGTKLLTDVQQPTSARGWIALASEALAANTLFATLRGHEEPLRAAAWSSDGQRVLTASNDGTARIWSASGQGDPRVLQGHTGPVTSAAWGPADARVLTASEDGTARIWDLVHGGEPIVLDAHAGRLRAATWSPDGKRVVTLTAGDSIARVWDAEKGGGMVELRGHTAALTAAVFLPDSQHVLTASLDKTARVFPADGRAAPVVFNGHSAEILFAAPSPDGARFITTSADRTARIWDIAKKATLIELRGHTGRVLHAAWSADGARVATAGSDQTARVWSAGVKGPEITFRGHGGAVTFVAFRPDGRYITTASRDQTARVWPAEGGAALILADTGAQISSAPWSPDGTRVLTFAAEEGSRSTDTAARIFRPEQLEALQRERPAFFHSAFIAAGAELVVSACDDRTARVWRVDGTGEPRTITGHLDWILDAVPSPDAQSILTVSLDRTARITRLDGAAPPLVLTESAPVRAAAWSPDGSRVVLAMHDGTARVQPADGKGGALPLKGHTDAVTSIAWSPGGDRIVTASLDHTARVFSATDGSELAELKGHGAGVNTAAFDKEGARIVTASEDGTARVWDAKSGAELSRLDGGSAVLRAIWSPDGKRVALAPVKGGLRLTSTDGAGQPVVFDTGAPVLAMTFLDDGKKILTVLEDNTTRTFTLDLDLLLLGLRETNADCLPPPMRATYLGEDPARASRAYAECERQRSRTPAFNEGKKP